MSLNCKGAAYRYLVNIIHNHRLTVQSDIKCNYIIDKISSRKCEEDSQYLLKVDIPGKIIENASHISGSMREKPWKQNC